ncbi:MAG: hypothetical protein ACN2B6_08285 [Rickettsiales bacterium]
MKNPYDGSMTTSEQDSKKQGPIDALKNQSLKAAGVAYLVGDAAMFAAGMMEGDRGGATGGLVWGLGSLAAARYGNPNTEKQLELLNRRLGNYLKEQGVEIPANPTTAELAKEGGVIDHIEKFLYAHPSQTLNAIYATGGLTTAQGGFRKNVKGDFAKGALVTAGGLSGILIPEKKPDPKHPPKDGLGKVWSWIQEKPLRVSGLFYHGNNVAAAYSIYEKWGTQKNAPKMNLYLRMVTVSSFIFANTMLALSSKGHGAGGGDDEKIIDQLAKESAAVIAAQPKPLQEALVQQISGYLAAQPDIDKKSNEIASLMHNKLREMGNTQTQYADNSWQNRVQNNSEITSPAI